jgi:hypothetical protein
MPAWAIGLISLGDKVLSRDPIPEHLRLLRGRTRNVEATVYPRPVVVKLT